MRHEDKPIEGSSRAPIDVAQTEVDANVRHRATLREDQRLRWAAIIDGQHLPTAADLLRGAPFFKGGLIFDINKYAQRVLEKIKLFPSGEQTARLRFAVDVLSKDTSTASLFEVVRILENIVISAENLEHPLRCNIYRGHLGDPDVALAIAMDAVAEAYYQDWHLHGDPTELVWRAMAWLVLASTDDKWGGRIGQRVGQKISPSAQLEAAAFEFRLAVGRAVVEISKFESSGNVEHPTSFY